MVNYMPKKLFLIIGSLTIVFLFFIYRIYDLAYMTSEPLTGERMDAFLKRSAALLEELAKLSKA